ncbi:hypothetical protein EHP00_1391 [Ecytonucleospora hepatopenaei]|uniref:Uncharacterized protein n=1 Tax=Ecytonucleospora hepatopenaei TaxID=646526 RepID=A0A1W0E8S6_9MICR|nr:hypothetical protein EHP00_1391 [Ecytonucleospora hepatopenaei]
MSATKNKDFSVEGVTELSHKFAEFLTYMKKHKKEAEVFDFENSTKEERVVSKDLLKKYKYELKTNAELEQLKIYIDLQSKETKNEFKKLRETIAKDCFIRMSEEIDKNLFDD